MKNLIIGLLIGRVIGFLIAFGTMWIYLSILAEESEEKFYNDHKKEIDEMKKIIENDSVFIEGLSNIAFGIHSHAEGCKSIGSYVKKRPESNE